MRLLYQSLSYVPSRRASAVHVMKMCAALARAGHDVTLATKRNRSRQEAGVGDDFAYYGVEESFEIRKLTRPSWKGGGLVHLWHARRLALDSRGFDLIYSRDLAAAVMSANSSMPLVFEAHGPPGSRWSKGLHGRLFTSRNLRRLVVISEALKSLFERSGLLPMNLDVVVAHDAADPLSDTEPMREALPASLTTPGRRRIGYVGHLYAGRGIEMMIQLARLIPDHDFHLIGGTESDLERWRSSAPPENLFLHGFVAPGRLPQIYRALDVLLAPYQRRVLVASGRTDTSAWMSPMKIFEYMAAGRPIIASDLPVLKEVLHHGKNALLVSPDTVEDWRKAVETVTSTPTLARALARSARDDFFQHHTWDSRAAKVLAGI